MLFSPYGRGLNLRGYHFRGHLGVRFHYDLIFALTLKVRLSVGFNILISRHAATLATGFGLLTWQVYLLLKIPAFAGHTTVRETLASYGFYHPLTE